MENKKKKKKFSFLEAIGLKSNKSKEPTINNAANTIRKRKKEMKSRLDAIKF